MSKAINKRERLEAIIHGESVDRPAVSLWRHWPIDDQNGEALAWVTSNFQKTFDFDFIKVTPNSNFAISGYGAKCQWTGNQEGTRDWGPRVIQSPEDWLKLKVLDPNTGLLAEIIKCNQLLGKEFKQDVPFIQTIFNPLAQAKNLAGRKLYCHLRQYPNEVKSGLNIITESIIRFIEKLKTTGVAGIFLAVQHASYDLLSQQEYMELCQPLDIKILQACQDMWFNMIHLHGVNVMFDLIAKYPAQVINWHDVETPPSLDQALNRTDMAVCGGLRQWETLVRGNPDAIRKEAHEAVKRTNGKRFILGTGCVTPITVPMGNVMAVRKAVDNVSF